MLEKIEKNIHLALCIPSPILENEPAEICSHLSGNGPKGRFLRPVGPKITRTKEMREGVCVLAYGRSTHKFLYILQGKQLASI